MSGQEQGRTVLREHRKQPRLLLLQLRALLREVNHLLSRFEVQGKGL